MFNLYSSWDNYQSDIPFDDDRKVALSSFRPLNVVCTTARQRKHLTPMSMTSVEEFDSYKAEIVDTSVQHQTLAENLTIAAESKDVYFRYGKGKKILNVLRGINLSVPEGAIYGLLGPSGCGKTSLLRCFVGRLKPYEGTIRIFGKVPGESGSKVPGSAIGYMPQELALFPDFTIEETLKYFGRLYRIQESVIVVRTEFLIKFLDLPDKRRLVGNLSGGQKRRVSLASALVHKPPLLILDEPTVGVDPLLRQCIWDYLVTLSKTEKLTVIITTHYIEEARAANVVGLMRFGRLLIEENPDRLLRRYNFATLEDVFLKLCELDSKGIDVNEYDKELQIKEANALPTPDVCNSFKTFFPQIDNVSDALPNGLYDPTVESDPVNNTALEVSSNDAEQQLNESIKSDHIPKKFEQSADTFLDSVARTSALFWKNITRLRRNLAVLLFQFLLPSIEVILFCTCIGKDPFDIRVAVYNEENPPYLSEWFLNTIDNRTIIQEKHNSFESAISAVKNGEAWAALTIGPNFSNALQLRVMMTGDVDNDTIEDSNIHLYPDMTSQMISFKLYETIIRSFMTFGKEVLTMLEQNPSLAEVPVVFEQPIYGDRAPNFTEFMAPGVLLSIAFLAAVALTALAFVMERKEGLLERSLVAGVSSTEFMLSHVLTQLLVLTVQVALLLLFTFLVFEIPSRGPFIWVILLTLLQASCGMAFGLMISAICTEENSATMLALGSFYPNLLLSGTVWPTQAMPVFIRYFSYLLPQTIPIEAMRYILSRGWGPQYGIVALGFGVTIVWTLFFLSSAVIIFRFRK